MPHNNGQGRHLRRSHTPASTRRHGHLPDAHPALKAVSPQAPVTNWFIGDDFHHNGAFFLMDAFRFYSSFGRPRPEPTPRVERAASSFRTRTTYEFFLRARAGPKNVQAKFFGDSIQFWGGSDETIPTTTTWWQARDPAAAPHVNVAPAVHDGRRPGSMPRICSVRSPGLPGDRDAEPWQAPRIDCSWGRGSMASGRSSDGDEPGQRSLGREHVGVLPTDGARVLQLLPEGRRRRSSLAEASGLRHGGA